ncbi:MAG: glycosyltransferase, partial [Planctomycetaceae bacterium]|nr:glycosyltransferase [Planctomycetaceae bacterium]
MPAYNAASTLPQTIADIPPGTVDEVILVDDCSKDNTVEVAKELGLTVIKHEKNLGYGGNQKTCYKKALEIGADY